MESVLEGCMDRGVVQGWVETGPMVKLIEVAQCCAMIESEVGMVVVVVVVMVVVVVVVMVA